MMPTQTQHKKLKYIHPEKISPNPENPRLIFRQEEMDYLLLSIDQHGIQVPISVYEDKGKYFLIDGERRWRCANKLNLNEIPSLIQDKPTELENLLLMYNIHALREQWDYYTIASKLQRVIDLYINKNNEEPGEIKLSEITGLTRGAIRRCQLLIDLPERYKRLLEKELELPKSQQKLSEDFFIEMERALKAVTRRLPEYGDKINPIRNTLVAKYKKGLIPAVTDFRQLSKIATAIDNFGIARKSAKRSLDRIFDKNNETGIREVYSSTVEFEYDERKASLHILSLTDFVDEVIEDNLIKELDKEFVSQLQKLYKLLKSLLGKK